MSSQPTRNDPMLGEVRFRLPLPIILPIGSIVVIGLFAIAFAEILLNVPKEAATVIAIATATNLLIGLSFIATRELRGARLLEVLAVMLYPVIIGAGLAIIGIGEGTAAHEQPANAAPATGGLVVTAQNIQFDTDSLALTAGEEATITFNNEDADQHNISIWDEEGGEALFEGDIVAGGGSTEYAAGPFEAGAATYFQCDVHPAMNGDVEVS